MSRNRIGGLGRRADQHEIDLVLNDQVLGDFGGAVRIGLAVTYDDFDGMGLAADFEAVLQSAVDTAEYIGIGVREAGQRSRLRADIADLDRARRGAHRRRWKAGRRERAQRRARFHELTPVNRADAHSCFPPFYSFDRAAFRGVGD